MTDRCKWPSTRPTGERSTANSERVSGWLSHHETVGRSTHLGDWSVTKQAGRSRPDQTVTCPTPVGCRHPFDGRFAQEVTAAPLSHPHICRSAIHTRSLQPECPSDQGVHAVNLSLA